MHLPCTTGASCALCGAERGTPRVKPASPALPVCLSCGLCRGDWCCPVGLYWSVTPPHPLRLCWGHSADWGASPCSAGEGALAISVMEVLEM